MAVRSDVLAVYDAAIFQRRRRLQQMIGKGWPQRSIDRQRVHLADAEQARAAVAELAEIAKKFDALYQPDSVAYMDDRESDAQGIFGVNHAKITLGDLRRLRAALAPFKGVYDVFKGVDDV